MKIGRCTDRSMMTYAEVDLTRNTRLEMDDNFDSFMIPTKDNVNGYRCVRLYRFCNYYVDWNGKLYHVDSPEKYDILVNIISTEFALAQLK